MGACAFPAAGHVQQEQVAGRHACGGAASGVTGGDELTLDSKFAGGHSHWQQPAAPSRLPACEIVATIDTVILSVFCVHRSSMCRLARCPGALWSPWTA